MKGFTPGKYNCFINLMFTSPNSGRYYVKCKYYYIKAAKKGQETRK